MTTLIESMVMKCFMIKNLFFFLLEIIDMNTNTSFKKIEFDDKNTRVQTCNFNSSGNLILYCENQNNKQEESDIVRIYSIQTTIKCQKVYMMPKEAEVISISKHDKIWFNF